MFPPMSSHQIWWLLSEGNNAVLRQPDLAGRGPFRTPISSADAQEEVPMVHHPRSGRRRRARRLAAVVLALLSAAASAAARSGSGSVLNPDGTVLTAAHVLEDCRSVAVVLRDGRRQTARLVAIDPLGDLALLRIPPLAGAVRLSLREDLRIGEEVEHHGFPQGAREAGRTVRSTVARLRGPREEPDSMALAGEIRPGESGSGVFDAYGNLVGMAYGGREPTWHAVQAGRIAEFLLLHGVPVAAGGPARNPLPTGASRRAAVRVICQGPPIPPRR